MESIEHLREENRVLIRASIGEPAKEGNLARCSTRDLLITLQTFLGELSARAIENPEAAESLWTVAHTACSDLWEVCERKPEIVRPFAVRKMTLPTPWPLLKKHQKKVAAMIKKLDVGTEAICRLPQNKKQFDPDTPANALVLRWVEQIHDTKCKVKLEMCAQHMAAILDGKLAAESVEDYVAGETARISDPRLKQIMSLPTLNRACADEWAKAIWEMVLTTHGEHPENDPKLREMGEHRGRHSEYIGQQFSVTPATGNANIRDGIKQRIIKAVRLLARSNPGIIRPE
jgi:hypothetical protein